jgi:hypothetical protein
LLISEFFSFSMSAVCLLGLRDLQTKWNELCEQLKALQFDRYDYAAMKFLALLDPCKRKVALSLNDCKRCFSAIGDDQSSAGEHSAV